MILSVVALVMPAVFDSLERGIYRSSRAGELDQRLSLVVSLILIFLYLANLVYTLITHRDVFSAKEAEAPEGHHAGRPLSPSRPSWSTMTSTAVLLGASAVLAVESQLLSKFTPMAAGDGVRGLASAQHGAVVERLCPPGRAALSQSRRQAMAQALEEGQRDLLEGLAHALRGEGDVEDDDAARQRPRVGQRARRREDEARELRRVGHLLHLCTETARRPQFAGCGRGG